MLWQCEFQNKTEINKVIPKASQIPNTPGTFATYSPSHGICYPHLPKHPTLIMTRKTWTTKPQEAWLKAQSSSFAAAEEANTRKAFFEKVIVAWRKEWPDPEPTEVEILKAGNYEKAVTFKHRQQDTVSVCSPLPT